MKPLHFVSASREDLKTFPEDVRAEAGFALYLAQMGEKSANAVPMVGFNGAKVLEVVISEDGDAYRAVYTVKFARAVYVLHAFQKKSKRGCETPKPDMRLIFNRLRQTEQHYEGRYGNRQRQEERRERAS